MFVLSELRDTVSIQSRHFTIKQNDAIVRALNTKFANRVIHNVGLCIALWDITKMDDSFIFPGDSASHTIVEFRYVMFRPFVDEILIGELKSCCKEGVYGHYKHKLLRPLYAADWDYLLVAAAQVTMGFFDEILIPADQLRSPSRFDDNIQLWYWEYELDGEINKMYMDVGDKIRFRVIDESFNDILPSRPEVSGETVDIPVAEKKSPYTILGSIHDSGLGMISWWTVPADEEEEAQ